MSLAIEFNAEVREVKIKKLVCLDKEIIVVLNTSNIKAIDLGKIASDREVKVRITEA